MGNFFAFRRKIEKMLLKFHNHAVDRIYESPEELGPHAPDSRWIILKIKEPIFPGFIAKVNKGSVVDLLFLYQLPSHLEIVVVEVKVGNNQAAHGIRQIDSAKDYFKYHWREWLNNQKINLDSEFNEVYFANLLLKEQPLEPVATWLVSKKRFLLGEINKNFFERR